MVASSREDDAAIPATGLHIKGIPPSENKPYKLALGVGSVKAAGRRVERRPTESFALLREFPAWRLLLATAFAMVDVCSFLGDASPVRLQVAVSRLGSAKRRGA